MPGNFAQPGPGTDNADGKEPQERVNRESCPVVSIVIPAYNHEPYIAAAIESVIAQTFKSWELIVIDDGSTDGTAGVAEPYARFENIRVLKQENRGLSATLNRGLSFAKGRYFGFLPSDDMFEPPKLGLQVDWLEKMPHMAALSTFQRLVDKNGDPMTDKAVDAWFRFEPETASDFTLTLLERNFIPAPSVLVRTEVLKDLGGFDTRCVFMQDYDLWLRLVKNHKMWVMPRVLLKYRWHGENQTYRATPETENERAYVLEKAVSHLDPADMFPELSEDPRPEIIASCRNAVKARFRKNAPTNLDALDRITDEKFGTLLQKKAVPLPDQREPDPNTGRFFAEDASNLSILLEVTHFDKGGLEQVVFDLALQLSHRGHRITVVCIETGGKLAKDLAEVNGISVEVLPASGKAGAFSKIMAAYGIDIVSAHYSTFGAALARREGIPVVSVLHNIYTWLPRDIQSEFRVADQYVSCYAAVSEDTARFAAKCLNISGSRIHVIPNGLDVKAWAAKLGRRKGIRKAFGFSEKDYLFLSVSSIYRVKGQDRIIRSFPDLLKKHPDARALLVGPVVDPPYYQWLRELITAHGLEDVIRIVEFTESPEYFYNEADAFVLPSFIEGWSIALMEAMYCGLPFIMTDIGGAGSILDASRAGRVIPSVFERISELDLSGIDKFTMIEDDPVITPLSNAMADFCENREKWAAAGKEGREKRDGR